LPFIAPDDLNDFPHVCIDSTGRVLVVDSWNNLSVHKHISETKRHLRQLDRGCVMVADSWNNRVVLLNKDLQSHRACSAEISVLTGPPDWPSAS